MAKNIVICSDGTGNTTSKGRGTNVFKLFEAVDVHGHRSSPFSSRQVAFYDDGVGTEPWKPIRLLTGALGLGLSRNVKELYADLARAYEPGDQIYLFGFSRGAFTVRTLAALIAGCGIVDWAQCASDDILTQRVEAAYEAYRERYQTDLSRWVLGETRRPTAAERARTGFRAQYPVLHPVRIRFIGVWDTVDAVGLPIAHAAEFINRFIYRFKFPDLKLSAQVDRACHAISIDDERHTFHPVMWGGEDRRIEQVWFAGVHSNVGGGYPKQGMSLVALAWMLKRAEQADLRFVAADRAHYWDHQNVHDKLYDSRAGLASYYRYKPRDIGKMCEQHHVTPEVHLSAIERILQGTDGYAPGNVPRSLEIVATEPEPRDLDGVRVANAIATALGQDRSLLDRVRGRVWVRRMTHYATLLLSVLIAALVLGIGWRSSGVLGLLGRVFSVTGIVGLVADAVVACWALLVPMAVVLGLVIVTGVLARRQMRRVFSEFWHGVVGRLRCHCQHRPRSLGSF